MDTALLIFTHNEKSTDKVLHILGNIQPRTFLNNTFHVRNINLGLDGPSNFGFFKANDHDESMAQTFIVQQAKLNCDPSASSIEKLRSIITAQTRNNSSKTTLHSSSLTPQLATTTTTPISTPKQIKIQ
eukprot:scaffold151438_cov33-Cyclotella_meneghiniana.AAC.1